MRVSSTAFQDGGMIPRRYTCDGDDTSPPLAIVELPDGTVTLALILEDPDAPAGTWDHWIAFDIQPAPAIPAGGTAIGTSGTNSWGRTGYGGPCPPGGTHRYVLTVYALDRSLGLDPGASKQAVVEAIDGHVLGEATLTGRYSRD